MPQIIAFDGPPPKIAKKYLPREMLPSIPTNKRPVDDARPSPWLPGERDRYRPVTPPGYVDACPIEASPRELKFRHSGWATDRAVILAAMIRCELPAARIERFKNCGGNAWVIQNPANGECRVTASHCGDRLCKACGGGRSAAIAAAIAAQMARKECRFVTLTTKHRAMPLADQISRIYQCFANLRRHKSWSGRVRGGAAFCEVKVGRAGLWHVHLHLIVEGSYFPKNVLASAWLVATGDSDIVDVRAVPDVGRVASYVAKYVTKPIDRSTLHTPHALDEAVLALRGRRLCLTFGTWRGVQLHAEKPPTEGWKTLGRLDHFIVKAEMNDPHAVRVILNLTRKGKPDDSPPNQPPDARFDFGDR